MELSKKLKEKTKAIHYTFLAIFIITLIGYPLVILSTKETIEVTIKKKDTEEEFAGRIKHMIHTQKGRVIKNSNSILLIKYNSDVLNKKLKVNETYEIEIIGLENENLGLYKNIIKINE